MIDISKIVNGELIRATLEVENKENLKEKDYVNKIGDSVSKYGYKVQTYKKDPQNKKIYNIHIEKIKNA